MTENSYPLGGCLNWLHKPCMVIFILIILLPISKISIRLLASQDWEAQQATQTELFLPSRFREDTPQQKMRHTFRKRGTLKGNLCCSYKGLQVSQSKISFSMKTEDGNLNEMPWWGKHRRGRTLLGQGLLNILLPDGSLLPTPLATCIVKKYQVWHRSEN